MYEWGAEYPSLEKLAEKFSVTEAEMRQALQQLVEPIKARGLPLPEYVKDPQDLKFKSDPTKPDPTFVMVAQEVLDVNSGKSLAAKLKKFEPLGVNTKTWNNWMENPVNKNYFQTLLDRRFSEDVNVQADLSIARNVAAGDISTIKFYKEITGRYRPQDKNMQSLTLIIQMMMEIFARHVSPEIIGKVADELDNLPIVIDVPNNSEAPALNQAQSVDNDRDTL